MGSSPAFPLRKWYGVRVRQRGPSIEVTVDGKALAMVTDTPSPYLSGRAGFYTEDAAATFEPVSITTS